MLSSPHGLEHLIEPWQGRISAQSVVRLAEALCEASEGTATHVYFLSYSWANSQLADHVEVLLRRNARDVLRDEESVKGGAKLSGAIQSMIDQADTVIALWSSHYSQSRWCSNELAYAQERCASGRRPRRVILLTLDNTDPPLTCADMLRPAATKREERELAVTRIVEAEQP